MTAVAIVAHGIDDRTITLADGRRLGFAQSGMADGAPVVLVPGYGHSRLAFGDPAITEAAGIRLISVDMPGVGLSDRWPGYTLLRWTEDLGALADALNLPRFAVGGWSWGAPYALAAAYCLPERVSVVGMISGLAGWLAGPGAVDDVRPEFRTFATWCRRLRPAARAFTAFQARGFRRDPDGTVHREAAETGGDDAAVEAGSSTHAMLVASGHEVWDRGGAGTYDHSLAVTQPWGFPLEDIRTHVEIWQGTADREILAGMADKARAKLSDANLHLREEQGHLLVFKEWAAILATLAPERTSVRIAG